MNAHLITVLFLLGALVCYVVGFALTAAALIAVGVVAECVFWIRLVRGIRASRAAGKS